MIRNIAVVVAMIGLLAGRTLADPADPDPSTLDKGELVQMVRELKAENGRLKAANAAASEERKTLGVQVRTLEEELKAIREQRDANALAMLDMENAHSKLAAALAESTVRRDRLMQEIAIRDRMAQSQQQSVDKPASQPDPPAAGPDPRLVVKLTEAVAQRDFLLQQNKVLREKIALLERQLNDKPASQPDSPVAADPWPPIKTVIAEVNGERATIEAGRNDGVKVGMIFRISRMDTPRRFSYPATLRIVEVSETTAVGELLMVQSKVKPGDRAETRLPQHFLLSH